MYLGYEDTLKSSTRTTMIPPLPGNSPQIKLINEFYRGMNEMNMDLIESLCHKDFSNVTLPKSLGVPPRGREASRELYATLGTGYGVSYAA